MDMATDFREFRRLRAFELKREGWKQKDIASALGVTEGAVSQWLKRAAEGGLEALRRRTPRGPRPRLSDAQRARLPLIVARGPEAYGFEGNFWTTKRLAAVIRHELGVNYHRGHVSRLVAPLGVNLTATRTRETRRDDEVVARWQTQRQMVSQSRH
jgi:transposase